MRLATDFTQVSNSNEGIDFLWNQASASPNYLQSPLRHGAELHDLNRFSPLLGLLLV